MLANALFSAGLVGKEEAEEVLGRYAEVGYEVEYSVCVAVAVNATGAGGRVGGQALFYL